MDLKETLVGHFVGGLPHKNTKPVSYVMQGDGLWEVRGNPLGVFRKHLAKARIPGLPCDLQEGFDLSIPKIPLALLWKSVAFFRKVYELHHSEAIVRVVYDRDSERYLLDCPPQEVDAAHCGFDRTRMIGRNLVVAEIHSHGQIQACFSGTDDKDELADRFYGVVGQVLEFFPQTCFRVSIGGKRLPVEVEDLFDVENDPMLGAKFPPKWLDRVKKRPRIVAKGSHNLCHDLRHLNDPEDPENMELPLWGGQTDEEN